MKKKLLIYFVIVLFSFIYYWIDLRQPQCADAQGCINISPIRIYGSVSGFSPGGCSSDFQSIFAPGTGPAWVALTGWSLQFADENQIDQIHVTINNINSSSSSNVTFDVGTCFNDDDDGAGSDNRDTYTYTVNYVVVRWR